MFTAAISAADQRPANGLFDGRKNDMQFLLDIIKEN